MSTINITTQEKTKIIIKPHPSTSGRYNKKPESERRIIQTFEISKYCKEKLDYLLLHKYGMLSAGQLLEIALARFNSNQHRKQILINIEKRFKEKKSRWGAKKDRVFQSFRVMPAYKELISDLCKGYNICKTDVVNCAIRLVVAEIENGEIEIDMGGDQ